MSEVEKIQKWLYLNPSVFVDKISNGQLFLLNTRSGERVISGDSILIDIVDEILTPKNLGVVRVPEAEKCGSLEESISKDILRIVDKRTVEKPFVLLPILSLQYDLDGTNEFTPDEVLALMNNKLKYLSGLNIYLSNNDDKKYSADIISYRNKAHLQYPVPLYVDDSQILTPDQLDTVLKQCITSSVARVNLILGVDNLTRIQTEKYVEILNKYNYQYFVHCYVEDCTLLVDYFEHQNTFNLSFFLYIDKYTNNSCLANVITLLENKRYEFKLIKLVRDEKDLTSIKETKLNILLVPVWTGANNIFFKENVMLNKNDIYTLNPSLEELFRNQKLNSNFFGIFDILNTGDVLPHGSIKKMGNIADTHLADLVSAELKDNNTWRLTRNLTKKCGSCIYRYLCPPISTFEIQSEDFGGCCVDI